MYVEVVGEGKRRNRVSERDSDTMVCHTEDDEFPL